MFRSLHISTTPRCIVRHGRLRVLFQIGGSHFEIVRSVPDDVKFHSDPKPQPPFLVLGAHNVILETIKRGDDDNISGSGPKTVVLRLYEAYGGSTTVKLLISSSIVVEKAIITNLLEDDHKDDLGFVTAAEVEAKQGYSHYIKISFRGFEVKTIKFTLGSGAKK
jgi:alpha-mannosidase